MRQIQLRSFKDKDIITAESPLFSFNEFPPTENIGKAVWLEAVMFMHRKPFNYLKVLQ